MLPATVVTLSALYSRAFLDQTGFRTLTITKGAAIICRAGMPSSKSMITIFYLCQDKDENSRLDKANMEALPRGKRYSKMPFSIKKKLCQ